MTYFSWQQPSYHPLAFTSTVRCRSDAAGAVDANLTLRTLLSGQITFLKRYAGITYSPSANVLLCTRTVDLGTSLKKKIPLHVGNRYSSSLGDGYDARMVLMNYELWLVVSTPSSVHLTSAVETLICQI